MFDAAESAIAEVSLGANIVKYDVASGAYGAAALEMTPVLIATIPDCRAVEHRAERFKLVV